MEVFLWILFIYLIICLVVGIIRRVKQKAAVRALTMDNVDVMHGLDFEVYVADLMRNEGYTVRVTRAVGDRGIDIIAKRHGRSYAVQVKRSNSNVGPRAIQEAYTGKDLYRCDRAMAVTNAYFTDAAEKMARKLHSELIDREMLGGWIRSFKKPRTHDAYHSFLSVVISLSRFFRKILYRVQHIHERRLEQKVALTKIQPTQVSKRGVVAIGNTVEYKDVDTKQKYTFRIVAGTSQPERGTISAATPTGRALLGSHEGETIEVETPGGVKNFQVLRIH